MSDYSKRPFSTTKDEEYEMLIEVTEEFQRQKREKQQEKSLEMRARALLLLKEGIDPNKEIFVPNDVNNFEID